MAAPFAPSLSVRYFLYLLNQTERTDNEIPRYREFSRTDRYPVCEEPNKERVPKNQTDRFGITECLGRCQFVEDEDHLPTRRLPVV